MGDKGRSSKGKQEGEQWETMGGKTLPKADTPSNKGQQEGVQWETRGKADTPSNKGKQEGAEWETKGDKIQEREARRGTRGDKTLGKADTRSNTKADTLRKH